MTKPMRTYKRLTLGVDILVGTSNRSLKRRFNSFSYANFNEISKALTKYEQPKMKRYAHQK